MLKVLSVEFSLAAFCALSYFQVWLRVLEKCQYLWFERNGRDFLLSVYMHLYLSLWNPDPNYLLSSGRLTPQKILLTSSWKIIRKSHSGFGTVAGISSILTSFPHTHSWKIQPRKCMKKAMELQIHSMPYAKASIEHQLSRALFTVQWYMHQIILFLWYIVQKLTNWTGRNLFKSHLLNSSFPLYE